MTQKPERREEPQPANICAQSLRALASGDLQFWNGLTPDCSRQDAETALGPSQPGPDGAGILGGSPTAFRRYPPSPAAPYGVIVWLVLDQIVLLQINSPRLAKPVEAILGEPEGKTASGLDYFHDQWIFANRGLVVHLQRDTHEVLRLYGFQPTSVEQFLDSWLSKVETIRRRR